MNQHLEKCLSIVMEATRGAGDESRTRRDPKRWSVVEIVEHLDRTYSGTAKGFERCVEKNAPIASGTTMRQRLQQLVLITFGYFPSGRAAPKHVLPTGEIDLGAVLDAVRRDLTRLDESATRARQLLGAGKMLDHPIIGALTVDQWLKFHEIHTAHHAKQIRQRR